MRIKCHLPALIERFKLKTRNQTYMVEEKPIITREEIMAERDRLTLAA